MKLFPRTVARFAAVQVVFQGLANGSDQGAMLSISFARSYFTPTGYALFGEENIPIDQAFFDTLVCGVFKVRPILEEALEGCLPEGWDVEQLEKATRAIFLCAGYELAHCPDIPRHVIFDEYITTAHGFLLDKGPAFVNAILEKFAPRVRSEEIPRPMKKKAPLDAQPPLESNHADAPFSHV